MSEYYENLKRNIDTIKNTFFPKEQSLVGDYTDKDYLKLAAYVFFVHAEFETYFEEMGKETVKRAKQIFDDGGEIKCPLLGLLCFSERKKLSSEVVKKTKNFSNLNLSNQINLSVTDYFKLTKSNHGIKEVNLIKLLLPIGFPSDKLPLDAMKEFDNFGSERGEIAHLSMTNFVKHRKDPFELQQRIERLLSATKDIDKEIELLNL